MASFAVFTADLERMNATLRELGAVKVTADGFVYVDTAVVPAALLAAYQGLIQYGYANGYL